ncbi:deleted in malignant brain tumors 1 protein-like, partial [Pecten maximus]|uniref:deleted in malignant brain tumors 1 protein-like n=1 Tax=Pecten maximus TaxID=6579 RepID=UPI00145845BE
MKDGNGRMYTFQCNCWIHDERKSSRRLQSENCYWNDPIPNCATVVRVTCQTGTCGRCIDGYFLSDGSCIGERIRLVNGIAPNEGRVEIYHDGQWGTVCDDNFHYDEARTVCEALGYRSGTPFEKAYFDRGTGPIFVDDLQCSVSDTGIHQLQLGKTFCFFNDWNVSNCDHGEDAGVICSAGYKLQSVTCQQSWTEYNSHCYKLFMNSVTWPEAQKQCRDHGSDLVTVENQEENNWLKNNQFVQEDPWIGAHTADIQVVWRWVSDNSLVMYSDWGPSEPNNIDGIEDCVQYKYSRWNDAPCIDSHVFICKQKAGYTRVRLVNGSTPNEGRVEIYHDGDWGTICDDNFHKDEARAVCEALGYRNGDASGEAYFGRGTKPIFVDNLNCSVSESGIHSLQLGKTLCFFNGWHVSDCDHGNDAGVICNAEHVHIRLVDGSTHAEGRAEIYHDGEWGTICDDNFHEDEARAVCEALGYRNGTTFGGTQIGTKTQRILVDLNCSLSYPGTHSLQLGETLCFFKDWNASDCYHGKGAGVACSDEYAHVRLMNGNAPNEGRVEIYHDGEWGTICGHSFHDAEALVVCRALDYRYGTPIGGVHFGRGIGPIFIGDLDCPESYSGMRSLQQGQTLCVFNGRNAFFCDHGDDAGVICSNIKPDEHTHVRLVNGTQNEGRVEIYHDGEWGT